MKIQYISDLHLEFRFKTAEELEVHHEADVFVLAGDIHTRPDGAFKFFTILREKTDIPILYIPGNHEYYGHDKDVIAKEYQDACFYRDVEWLDDSYASIGDVFFIGSTLYSDLSNSVNSIAIQAALSDFRCVKRNGKNISVQDWNGFHEKSVERIERPMVTRNIKGCKKIVVITHFVPLFCLSSGKFPRDPISDGFYSNLENLIEEREPDMWIYGHNHDPVDMDVFGCKMRSNQYGYPHEKDLKLKSCIEEI